MATIQAIMIILVYFPMVLHVSLVMVVDSIYHKYIYKTSLTTSFKKTFYFSAEICTKQDFGGEEK